ncbi:MAG: hypothetical protein JW820_14560, partial [Spirochaetales bacterium]|nr:hypothetical protein [Spirochaetales bacterium]
MGKYDGLSDQERRKLYRDLSRAASEIRVGEDRAAGPVEGTGSREDRDAERRQERGGWERRFRRPRYGLRLRIDSYAYAEGFAVTGARQYLGSLFSFLWPRRDRVNPRFVRELVLDDPHRADPSGYGLAKTLEELQRSAAALLG